VLDLPERLEHLVRYRLPGSANGCRGRQPPLDEGHGFEAVNVKIRKVTALGYVDPDIEAREFFWNLSDGAFEIGSLLNREVAKTIVTFERQYPPTPLDVLVGRRENGGVVLGRRLSLDNGRLRAETFPIRHESLAVKRPDGFPARGSFLSHLPA
jgi:hypothetical protein